MSQGERYDAYGISLSVREQGLEDGTFSDLSYGVSAPNLIDLAQKILEFSKDVVEILPAKNNTQNKPYGIHFKPEGTPNEFERLTSDEFKEFSDFILETVVKSENTQGMSPHLIVSIYNFALKLLPY